MDPRRGNGAEQGYCSGASLGLWTLSADPELVEEGLLIGRVVRASVSFVPFDEAQDRLREVQHERERGGTNGKGAVRTDGAMAAPPLTLSLSKGEGRVAHENHGLGRGGCSYFDRLSTSGFGVVLVG